MQTNPNTTATIAPAAIHLVNLFKGQIFVYQARPTKQRFTTTEQALIIGKKIHKFPQDKKHLELVKQLYPGAIMHGILAEA